MLQATNDITLEDLADDELNFAPGSGVIALTADADRNGVGDFVMEDTSGVSNLDVFGSRSIVDDASDLFGDPPAGENQSGNIKIDGSSININNSVVSSQTGRNSDSGNISITGKGGIVPEPGLPLNSLNVTVNGEFTSATAIPAPIETSKGKIQPARGIKVTESGEIILTAYRTNNAGDRLPEIKRNCGRV